MKPQVYKDPRPGGVLRQVPRAPAREAARTGCTSSCACVLTPYLLLVYRARCIDSHNVPAEGPVIVAPNHFSFLDHFFVAVFLRRKVQFMAKSQLFKPPLQFIYHNGGVFPVRRGHHDEEAFKTAHAILDRGDMIVMYAEAGRSRTGELGKPRHGIGRLALESGVPVVPDRDRRHRARPQLEAPPVPEGHDPVRRAAPVRAGGGADQGAGPGGLRDRLRARPRDAPRLVGEGRKSAVRPRATRADQGGGVSPRRRRRERRIEGADRALRNHWGRLRSSSVRIAPSPL